MEILLKIRIHFINKFLYQKSNKNIVKQISNLLKIVVSGSIMGVFIYYFKNLKLLNMQSMDLLITIIFACLLYFVALLALKIFSKEDINIFRSIRIKMN